MIEKEQEEKNTRLRERAMTGDEEGYLFFMENEEKELDLRAEFIKFLKKRYPTQWPKLSKDQKKNLLKQTMIQYRIPRTPKGGKRKTRRHKSKKIVRKTNKRKSKKSRKLKRKHRKTRRK
jgi:hypothetical protein